MDYDKDVSLKLNAQLDWKRREEDFITDDWKIHYEQIKTTNLDDQPKLYTPVKSDKSQNELYF